MLLHKFSMCPVNVKCSLFRAFYTPMYAAHLWCSYRESSMQRLIVAYNDAMRLWLQVPESIVLVNCLCSLVFLHVRNL